MKDPRIEKLADVLVNYSAAVKKGDLVMIGGSTIGTPLVTALCSKVIAAGAHPIVSLQPDELAEIRLSESTDEHGRWR